ncbi:MAG TPA: MBL fold metallo-hydrolase [Polyangiaceae bacterium]|nr:MBL fold metallo-hydrolase [Polyangiaceae bacterium]
MAQRYIDHDIVKVHAAELSADGKKQLVTTLFWGDRIEVTGQDADHWKVDMFRREWNETERRYDAFTLPCLISRKVALRDEPFVLKARVVDVGQGDAAVVETPEGEIILIDGGEQSHLTRYLSASFAHVLTSQPLDIAAVVVTHGDADHYNGLTELLRAERAPGKPLITAQRVFHNGLVKGPSGNGPLFGETLEHEGRRWVVDLENDLRRVPEARMNRPFLGWKQALSQLRTATGERPSVRRLAYGDDSEFDFLGSDQLAVHVLGPIVRRIGNKDALPYLRTPGSRSYSDSHTINGHSIVLKMTYGNVRFLFGADLNEESQEALLARARADNTSLEADVFKVPHHGSADFSARMFDAVRPVVSVVSSGDESSAKEYIHPRAGLVGALGRYSRGTVERPLVYVTEMVAFFERVGNSFRLYQKKQFGIVHVRTNGQRVLVATHSGKSDQKESYVFTVNERGDVAFEPKARLA